ncbi:MAG: hypothetical protein ACFB4I_18005 [Cyanophyceae cyanobacterium]
MTTEAVRPPEERKSRQQRQFDWVPDGPWLVDGKLDPNFVDWQARDWIKAYGGDIHKKRSDVLRHFKKDAANLAIAWEQYRSEQYHRYSNAALRVQSGMPIQAEEQQQLLAYARAITEGLPEEMSATAVGQSERVGFGSKGMAMPVLPAKVIAFPGSSKLDVIASSHQEMLTVGATANSSFQVAPVLSEGSSSSLSLPTDSYGFAENPDAYKEWKPQPVEREQVTPQQFKEKLAELAQKLSMYKSKDELKR